MKLPRSCRKIAVLLTLCVSASSLPAVPLNPGNSTALSLEVEPTGALLLATTNVAFNGVDVGNNILFSGTLASSVWANDSSNPLGGYTFTYQLSSDPSSLNSIDRMTLNRFSGFQTDVGYNGSGVIPIRASRPTSDLIAFVFENAGGLPTLGAGLSSPILVIQTDANVWSIGNASVIDGATANVVAFVPLAVPEPATAGLFALAGVALLALRRKT
jgi:hypothetical protein